MRKLFLLACLFLPAHAHAAGPPDAALLAAARAAQPAVVESLKAMTAIESGSADAAGLEKMAAWTAERLAALGGTVERLSRSDGGPGVLVKGSFQGDGKLRVMLIAHMDTVYASGILAGQPIREDGNRLYGPGIADDKSGIAVILHALGILRAQGWRDFAQITVLFNPDEEVGSPGSGETIATLADQHDVVLSFEPNGAKSVAKAESLLLAASGTAFAYLDVEGRAAHAGAAPLSGRNALMELAYQLVETRDVASRVQGAQLNWTLARAGEARNQIPDKASATGDVRITEPDAADRLQKALQAKVDERQLVPGTRTTVTVKEGRPMYVANLAARRWAERAQAIYAELDGRELKLIGGTGGGTDAGFASRSGKVMVLEAFGLAGAGYHARDEYVEIDSIVPRLYLVTRMLQELGREGARPR